MRFNAAIFIFIVDIPNKESCDGFFTLFLLCFMFYIVFIRINITHMNKISLSLLIIAILAILQSTLAGSVKPEEYLSEVKGPACPLCTLLVGKVKDAAKDYEGKITDEFKSQVCGRLPQSIQGLCDYFVDDYGKQVIDALLNKVEPHQICAKIGLCEDNAWFRKYVTDTQAYLIYMDLIKMGQSNDNCAMCKYLVSLIEDYANRSRDELEAELLKGCKALPGAFQQLCDTVVLLYGRQILDYILEYETPSKVCEQVKLCPATVAEPVDEDTVQCELCKYVLNLVEDYIRGNDTEAKIKEALEKVCDHFPPLKKQCLAFVDTYEPLIIEFVLQKLPPAEICKKIGLCADSLKQKIINDSSACPLCKFVVGTVEDYLEKNETVDFIKQKVDTLCGYLPAEYASLCTYVADQYIVLIIQYLEQKYTPDVICQKIGLCDAAKSEPFIGLPLKKPAVSMRTN